MGEHSEPLDRRRFVSQSAGLVAGLGWLGSNGSLEGLRAALAAGMGLQKPLLREESLNVFLAEARAAGRGEAVARDAAADLGGFLRKNFEVDDKCSRFLSTLSKEDTAKITQALQEGFSERNQVQVELANVDLQRISDPTVDVQRANTVGDDAQLTMIRITPTR